MKKILYLVLGIICCAICLYNISFAETFEQKKGLFTIDIPEGWKTTEYDTYITISNPSKDNGIDIEFAPEFVKTEEVEYMLQNACKIMTDAIRKRQGSIIEEKTTEVDGIYARQIDFRMLTSSGFNDASQLLFFNKGYKFIITYGSANSEEKSIMDKIVKTFKK